MCYEVSDGSLNPTPVSVTPPTGQDVPLVGHRHFGQWAASLPGISGDDRQRRWRHVARIRRLQPGERIVNSGLKAGPDT